MRTLDDDNKRMKKFSYMFGAPGCAGTTNLLFNSRSYPLNLERTPFYFRGSFKSSALNSSLTNLGHQLRVFLLRFLSFIRALSGWSSVLLLSIRLGIFPRRPYGFFYGVLGFSGRSPGRSSGFFFGLLLEYLLEVLLGFQYKTARCF